MWDVIAVLPFILVAPASDRPAIAERPESVRLDRFLKTWELQSNRGQVVQIKFWRFDYDKLFKTEKRTTGRLVFDAENYRVDIEASKYGPEDKSNREGYKLARFREETWAGNASRTVMVDHHNRHVDIFNYGQLDGKPAVAEKQFFSYWIGTDHKTTFRNAYYSRFLRIRSNELKRRFDLRLTRKAAQSPVLTMLPNTAKDSCDCQIVRVLWSSDQQRVHAVQIIDPTGSLETVYTVISYQTDPKIDLHSIYNPEYPTYTVREHE